MKQIHDVVVIGAGIAGGGIAYALASMGWETVLIDRHEFPRHKVCGEFLSPESRSILHSLGLHSHIAALHHCEIGTARLTSCGGVSLEIPLPAPALGISRYDMDHALHHAVREKGGMVRTGVTVLSVSAGERGFTVSTGSKHETETIEARAVIAAWGRNPHSRLTADPKPVRQRSYVGVKSYYEGMSPSSAVELYFFPGGYVGVSPVGGGMTNAAAVITYDAFLKTGKTVFEVMETAAQCNPALQRRLADGKPVPGTQAAAAPVVTSREVTAWNRFPFVGDAAAVIPPLCGDGMAIALRSGELCALLADGYLQGTLSLSDWQHKYSKQLSRELASPLRWGGILQTVLENPVLSSAALQLGLLSPRLALRLFHSTRLRGSD